MFRLNGPRMMVGTMRNQALLWIQVGENVARCLAISHVTGQAQYQ